MRASIFALLVLSPAAFGEKPPAYEWPKGGIVIRLKEEQLAAQPGYVLDVLPDGTVRENGTAYPAKLTAGQMQALVHFAVDGCKVFEHDAKALARALGDPPPGCGFGRTTTAITLTLKGRAKTVRVPMLRTNADRLPGNKALQRVLALRDRLRLEAKLARHGGRKKIERLLAAANQRLKQRFPKEKPLAIETFLEIRELPPKGETMYPEGWDPNDEKLVGKTATFQRITGTPQRILSAIVSADGKIASVNLQK